MFDDRRYAKGPNVFRFGAEDMTHVSELSGDDTQNSTYFDISSLTGFRVSKTLDKRLLANTSGVTSMNI